MYSTTFQSELQLSGFANRKTDNWDRKNNLDARGNYRAFAPLRVMAALCSQGCFCMSAHIYVRALEGMAADGWNKQKIICERDKLLLHFNSNHLKEYRVDELNNQHKQPAWNHLSIIHTDKGFFIQEIVLFPHEETTS